MSTKQLKEMKKLSKDELSTKIRDTETTLFQARLKKSTGQLEDTTSIWRLRKELARYKTLHTQQSQSQAGSK